MKEKSGDKCNLTSLYITTSTTVYVGRSPLKEALIKGSLAVLPFVQDGLH